MRLTWLLEVHTSVRFCFQFQSPDHLTCVRCVICAVKSLISAVSSITVTSLLVIGRQSGVACASEMASSTSCTMRPSSLPQCTDFQQFALPRDNKRLSLKRACSASSFATGCAGCLQTPPAEGCVRAGDGFLATDARNSPEACCVGLSCVPDPVCMSHSCQLPAGLGP